MALCLLGFEGKGYSPGFIARMAEAKRHLDGDPATQVRLDAAPDALCDACPHLRPSGCTLAGEGHEAHMRAQDLEVLRRLGLQEGAVLPWREVLDRVAARVTGADLPAICTTCPWLALGVCARGVDGLRRGREGGGK